MQSSIRLWVISGSLLIVSTVLMALYLHSQSELLSFRSTSWDEYRRKDPTYGLRLENCRTGGRAGGFDETRLSMKFSVLNLGAAWVHRDW